MSVLTTDRAKQSFFQSNNIISYSCRVVSWKCWRGNICFGFSIFRKLGHIHYYPTFLSLWSCLSFLITWPAAAAAAVFWTRWIFRRVVCSTLPLIETDDDKRVFFSPLVTRFLFNPANENKHKKNRKDYLVCLVLGLLVGLSLFPKKGGKLKFHVLSEHLLLDTR